MRHRKPLVSGAAIRMDGQLAVFDLRAPEAPCYACVYGEGTDGDLACNQAGIVGPVVVWWAPCRPWRRSGYSVGAQLGGKLHLFDGRSWSGGK